MRLRACIAPLGGLAAVLLLWLPLKLTHLVINTSDSLPHNAYAMIDGSWLAFRGAYVAVAPPAIYRDRFPGVVFVKQLRGRSGDALEWAGGTLCLRARCYAPAPEGAPSGMTPPQIIPKGAIALFGDSPSSLDSRYAVIGLFERGDIVAAGFPIPFWHWREVRAWLDRRS